MFTHFVDLPVELALEVIEHAGWSCSSGWVASALLVDRAFCRTLLPILYHTVCITPHNCSMLSRLPGALRGNFELTRHVVFADSLDCRAAMQRLRAVACDIPSYFALRHDPAFAPEMLLLTRPCDALDVFGWLARRFTGTTLCVLHPLSATDALDEMDLADVRLKRLVPHRADAGLEASLHAGVPALDRVEFFAELTGKPTSLDAEIELLIDALTRWLLESD